MILKIYTYPDPILKKKAKPVAEVTPELKVLAQNMLETMYAAPGIGLAAPQVGESIRLIVVDTRPRDEAGEVILEEMTELERKVQSPLILFNPEIVKKEGSTTFEEGCLSVPGFTEIVERANWIELHALNEDNQKVVIQTDGLLAICLQHELDHLEGKLFIDRISFVRSSLIKNKIKKHGYADSRTRQIL